LVVILFSSATALVLNSSWVQQKLIRTFVDPILAQYDLSIEFEGAYYLYPNTVVIPHSQLYFHGEPLIELGEFSIQEFIWEKGLLIRKVQLDQFLVKQTLDSALLYSLETSLYSSEDSASSPFAMPFSLRIGTLEIQNIQGSTDENSVDLSITLNEIEADSTLFLEKGWLEVIIDEHNSRLALDSLSLDFNTALLSSNMQVDYPGIGTFQGNLHYAGDSISSVGKVLTESQLDAALLPQSPWMEYATEAVIDYSLSSIGDLLLLEFGLFTPEMEGFGHMEYRTNAQSLEMFTDLYPQSDLYTSSPMNSLSVVWDHMAPEEIGVAIHTDFKDQLEFEFHLKDDVNSIVVSADKFSEPARLQAYLPELNIGPLQGVELRTALVPSVNAVLQQKAFSLNGVMPRIWMEQSEIRGLSFSYHHDSADSIWISCLDSNLDVDGYVLVEDDMVQSSLQLNRAGLYVFDRRDTGQFLSGDFTAAVSFDGEGEVSFENVLIQRPLDVVFLRKVHLQHHHKEDGYRMFMIDSDVLKASITGNWEFEHLNAIGHQMAQHILVQEELAWQPAELYVDLDAGNIGWITDLLHINASLSEDSHILGSYNGPNEHWSLSIDIPELSLDNLISKDLLISSNHSKKSHSTRVSLALLEAYGLTLDTLVVGVKGTTGLRHIQSSIVVRDSIPSSIHFDAELSRELLHISSGDFNIGNSHFELIKQGEFNWRNDAIFLDSVGFTGENGAAFVYSEYSDNQRDVITKAAIEGLDAKVLNYLLRTPEFTLGGVLNARATWEGGLDQPRAKADIVFDQFALNSYTYGELSAGYRYETAGDMLTYGYLQNQGADVLNFRGRYRAQKEELDLRISLDRFDIAPFNPLLAGVLDELEGQILGGLTMYGPVDDWSLDGSLALSNGHFTVPVVGAELATSTTAEITITDRSITLDSTLFYVPSDSTLALAWGGITHDHFSDVVFNLQLHTDSIRAVDMERNIDSYFYGTAIAAGDMLLEGPLEQLHLDLAIATKDGTHFKIPLDNPTAIETPSFLHFIADSQADTLVSAVKSLEYFTTDIAIEATPDAKLELVLDEVLGDVIKAQGAGNLRLKLLEDESMELFGLYTVESGSYLFTLQNIINKPFTLVPGGTILWSGDLYEAEINLEAKYSLSTDLEGLVTSSSYNNENVDVDLLIELSGALMSPEIAFRVELPESPASYTEELQRHFLTADAMNYQAFSLLMLGEFFKQDLGIQENVHLGSSVSKTTSELLVSEFGSWLAAGIGSYVDLELDYTSGTNPYNTIGTAGDQLNLGVSKDFFEGRLRVNSSLDIPIAQGGTSTLMLGDTEVAYSLTKDGRIVLRAFNRSNRNDPLLQSTGPYTQGVGIMFQKEFETVTKKD